MKFSLFFEMQLADSSSGMEAQLFRDCVQQAKLADELGYHCVWEVEHHGLYEYSHSSAPEVFLSFIAAQTKKVRIGHGCTLLPYRYNHPIRVAERIATLDILSEGRVNWGSARSGSRVEREAFEVDATTLHDEWLEALQMIPRMWNTEPYSHAGRFFNIPLTHIVPKPLQKPHPPMFAACSKPDEAKAVGALGLGALTMAMYRDEAMSGHVRAYREAIEAAKPVGLSVNNHFACNAAALVLKDDQAACRNGLRGALYFTEAMIHYYKADRPVGSPRASRDCLPDSYVENYRRIRNSSQSQLSAVIGDPIAAREAVQRFVDAGVDELILVMQTGTTAHELTMESIRVFGEKVMPYFC